MDWLKIEYFDQEYTELVYFLIDDEFTNFPIPILDVWENVKNRPITHFCPSKSFFDPKMINFRSKKENDCSR